MPKYYDDDGNETDYAGRPVGGATPLSPEAQAAAEEPGQLMQGVNQFGKRAVDFVKGLGSLASDATRPSTIGMPQSTIDTLGLQPGSTDEEIAALIPGGRAGMKLVKGLAKSQWGQALKAKEAYGQGHTSEAIGHGAAALIPAFGPAAADIGEKVGAGKFGEAGGDIAFELASQFGPGLATKALKTSGRLAGKAAPAVEASAVRDIQHVIGPTKKTVNAVEDAIRANPDIAKSIGIARSTKQAASRLEAATGKAGEAVGSAKAAIAGEATDAFEAGMKEMEKILDESTTTIKNKLGQDIPHVRRPAEAAFSEANAVGSDLNALHKGGAQAGGAIEYASDLQDAAKRAKVYEEGADAAIKGEVAGRAADAMKKQLHAEAERLGVPYEAADKAFSTFKEANDAMRQTMKGVKVGNRVMDAFATGVLGRVAMRTLIGGGIGAALTGGTGALIGAVAANSLASSAFWKTMSAATKRELAAGLQTMARTGSSMQAAKTLNRAAMAFTIAQNQSAKNQPLPVAEEDLQFERNLQGQ